MPKRVQTIHNELLSQQNDITYNVKYSHRVQYTMHFESHQMIHVVINNNVLSGAVFYHVV